MGTFLGIVLIAVVIYFYNAMNKKIDADEQKAMSTPGVAQYIRKNFLEIVNCVNTAPGFVKEFERNDYMRFINATTGQKVVLQQWSGKLKIIVVKNGNIEKEWEIGVKDMDSLLLSKIKKSIGNYSYWQNYKEHFPQKAADILKLTRINMVKKSDIAAREIVESIERWSRNTGKPIAQLKQYFIESAIKTFGVENLDLMIDKLKQSEMDKEAVNFGIEKDHTIARFMIEALDEYSQSEKERKIEEHLKGIMPDLDIDTIRNTADNLNLAPDISHLNNKENRLMSLLEECCDILEHDFKELSLLGRCEAILFFSTHVMDYGELKNEINMDEYVDRFKFLLMDKIAFEFDTNNIFEFLNARVAFYKEEYQRMKENTLYIPLALYNLFYLNPGCDNPEDIAEIATNTTEAVRLHLQLLTLINYINNTKENI